MNTRPKKTIITHMQTPASHSVFKWDLHEAFGGFSSRLFSLTRVYIDYSYCICIDPLHRLLHMRCLPKVLVQCVKEFSALVRLICLPLTLPHQTPSFTRPQTCLIAPCFVFDPWRCHVKLCFCFVDVMTIASTILMMW